MSDPSPTVYPVALRGHPAPELHRWKWLVKWFLALPHLFVLALLWLAFVVLTFVAGVSIAFTGRYPRGIFDFNVGVMRWTWRVQYYAFALGTDRYPPFSLEADDAYPADLEVAYPEQLSRGLVWVKWWLLAIPHYLIVGLFLGGTLAVGRIPGGLAGILGLIAGVTLAATRRYPDSVFRFLLGLYRWSWRVTAYAALMRDEYPPFRIDMGPDEPAPEPAPEAPPGDPRAA